MNTEWLEVAAILALGAVLLLWVYPWNRRRPRLELRPSRASGAECEIIPRRDATPQQLKQLAGVLDRWIPANATPSMTTNYALADLHEGELPQPLSVALEHYLDDALAQRGLEPPARSERAERRRQILEKLGRLATTRTILLRVPDARQAAASLREAIPADLVDDILIDRRSWAEGGGSVG
jgi:hypothetical protein